MAIRRLLVVTLLGFAGLGGCAPATVGRQIEGLGNFATVTTSPTPIYRGAQPTPEGVERLARKDLNVSTVIDLRDDAESWEEAAVTSHGMTYKRIPTNARTIDTSRIREFLVAVAASPGPIYLHCREGRDRAGLAVAMYRVLVEGWTRQAAVHELRQHGYNRFWFPGIEHFILTFDPREFPNLKRAATQPTAARY